jgi:hypothetical protein
VFWCCPVFCCLYGVLSTIISPSFLVIVFWCYPVFCCLYGVLSTIISPFFLGYRVFVLPRLLLSIWCSVHHYFHWATPKHDDQEKRGKIMVNRTPYTKQKTEQH